MPDSRASSISGAVDATTWERLVEAGWRLGHRLLYLAHPTLRGDDVAELQVRLAQFGFNPGRQLTHSEGSINEDGPPVLRYYPHGFARPCGLCSPIRRVRRGLRPPTGLLLLGPERALGVLLEPPSVQCELRQRRQLWISRNARRRLVQRLSQSR